MGTGPGPTFAEAVRRLADAAFVGREGPLADLQRALAEAASEPRIVPLVGLAGVGKTTLARRFARAASAAGHRVVWLEGERLAATAGALEAELEVTLDGGWSALGRSAQPDVLVIDAFERFDGLERWLLEDALGRAGAAILVVITSRRPLDERVVASLGVAQLVRPLDLQGLSRDETLAHLSSLGVPAEEHEALHRLTAGHPLTLTLAALRRRADPESTLGAADDAVDLLVTELLTDVEADAQREALFALSLARATDLELLSAMLGRDAREDYEWAAGLPFVRRASTGLVPHALVRDALHRELAARHPERIDELTAQGLDVLLRRAQVASLNAQRDRFLEAIYLNRHRPAVKRTFDIGAVAATSLELGREAHLEPCAALVRAHLGERSEALFRGWVAAQPERFHVVCDAAGQPIALSVSPFLDGPAPPAADPVAEVARAALEELGGSKDSVCFRFYVAEGGHGPFARHMTSLMCSGPFITGAASPRPRAMVYPMPDPDAWMPLTRMFPLRRSAGHEASCDGHRYGVYLGELTQHQPPTMTAADAGFEGLRWMARRIVGADAPAPLAGPSPDELEGPLRDALKDLHRPPQLRESPLARLPGIDGDPARLAGRLTGLIDRMADNPRYADGADVLRLTYVEPAAKQQAAAAELGLPFGTYRYRLRKAVADLAELLAGDPPPD